MSPLLSRENYFISILNQLDRHPVQSGSLEHKLQELLLDLAQTVLVKHVLDNAMVMRINLLFEEYQAVRLKVSIVAYDGDSCIVDSGNERTQSVEQHILLHTEFVDASTQVRRMYMESIISLLEAMEKKQLNLQKCIQCNSWFIPYQRAQVTKFCHSKCRNRYNYLLRSKHKEEAAM